tara:strand:- start:361 stop:849 length:489 start_codon:yes stop_codon:yes gene_type:complete
MQSYYPTLKTMRPRDAETQTLKGKSKHPSVQLVQSLAERKRMLQPLCELHNMYKEDPSVFPKRLTDNNGNPILIGNDHKSYTVKQLFSLWAKKLPDHLTLNEQYHIFESSVVRHNAIIEHLANEMADDDRIQNAESMIKHYYICYDPNQHIPTYRESLFETV